MDRKRVLARKGLHLLGGIGALLPWTRPIALIVTGIGTLFNATLLARLPFFRQARRGPRDAGYYTYPLGLFFAFLLFSPEIARAAWVELAVGDWAATFFGLQFGGPAVPWNRKKTLAGVAAHWILGTGAVLVFARFGLSATWDPYRVAGIVAACALVETLVSEGWDNPLVTVMFGALARWMLR